MPSDEVSDFFEALYARKDAQASSDGWLLIWTKGNDERQAKTSFWAEGIDDAIGIARHESDAKSKPDVYFGCATCKTKRGANQRVTNKTARALFFVWADIDVAGPGHKGKKYPNDIDAAIELAASIGLKPSLIVHSGGGIHAYWVLDRPVVIETDEQRLQCSQLTEGFQAALRARAAKNGWSIDSTFDLARVLRVPGTINHKYNEHVRILDRDPDAVYSFDELNKIASETPLESASKSKSKPKRKTADAPLAMNAAAEPPLDKLEVLCEYDSKFRVTYERKRKDLESQSEYDLALASFAVIAGWNDQEIADLIIHHRRKHNEDTSKAQREDYIRRTIRRSRSNVQFDEAQERISENLDAIREGEQTIEETREEILRDLSETLQVQINEIVKYLGDPPLYKLRTPDGEITIGNVKSILRQEDFRACLADTSSIVIRRFKGPRWDEIAQAILKACIVEDLGMNDQMMNWVESYIEERHIYQGDERNDAMSQKQPFVYKRRVAIFLDDFRKWLGTMMHVRVNDQRKLAADLRACGAEMIRVRFGKTTRSVCLIPLSPGHFERDAGAKVNNEGGDEVPF